MYLNNKKMQAQACIFFALNIKKNKKSKKRDGPQMQKNGTVLKNGEHEFLKVEKSLSRKSNEDDLSSNPFFRK